MFPRPRYHGLDRRADERGNEICAAARTLLWLLGSEARHNQWRDGRWYHQQNRRQRRNEPRMFISQPLRQTFPGPSRPRQTRLHPPGIPRREREWPRGPQGAHPRAMRSLVLPRRGPPVATIRAPDWPRPKLIERQPRGSNPRGPLRGGPERSADDLRRNPRDGLCGGPGRSAKEPQPQKLIRVETNGGRTRKQVNKNKKPIIITMDKCGRERK